MAEVITRLKVDNQGYDQKIRNAQRSLDQFGLKGTEVGQKMSGLGRVLTTNIGALSKWSVGLGAASAALKVAGDAFKQNEVLMDEWNGTVEGAKGVYDSFLNALNTGDFSGFFSRMGKVAAAARAAYDALDNLGTFNAFNQIQIEGARTGFTEAMAGFRTGESTKADVQAAADELKKELLTRQDLEQKAYEAAIEKLAVSRKVGFEDLKKVLTGEYGDYETLRNTPLTGVSRSLSADMDGNSIWLETPKAANETERLGEMLRKLSDDELKDLQALGAQAQRTATEIAQIDKQTAKLLADKKTTEPKATKPDTQSSSALGELGLLEDYRKTIAASMQFAETADDLEPMQEELNRVDQKITMIKDHLAEVGKEMRAAFDAEPPANFADIAANASNVLSESVENTANAAEATKGSWESAAASVAQLGSALQSTESKELNVAGIIAQAIANVALGLGEALSTKNHETAGPWDWIAAAISGTATMIGTIASIKSATSGFANGGMVLPNGSPYQGDNIVARLNAGEGVLTQQGIANAVALADGSGFGNLHLEAVCKAEEFRVMLKNNDMRRGRRNTYR